MLSFSLLLPGKDTYLRECLKCKKVNIQFMYEAGLGCTIWISRTSNNIDIAYVRERIVAAPRMRIRDASPNKQYRVIDISTIGVIYLSYCTGQYFKEELTFYGGSKNS